MGNVADYKQTDPRWSNIKYAGDYVYGSGCGATACANIIAAVNNKITPKETAIWAEANGLTANGQGTYWGGIVKILEHWNLECTMLNGSNYYGKYGTEAEKSWKKMMKTGDYWGILLMGASIFTIGGHYITAAGYDGELVDIHDPYSSKLTKKHTWDSFNGKVKIFYVIKKPETDYTINSVVKFTKNVKLYSEHSTSSQLVKSLNKGIYRYVTKGFGNWGYIPQHKAWVILKDNSSTVKTTLTKTQKYVCNHYSYRNTRQGYKNKNLKIGSTIKWIRDMGDGWSQVVYNNKCGYIKNSCIALKGLSSYPIGIVKHEVKVRTKCLVNKNTETGIKLAKGKQFKIVGSLPDNKNRTWYEVKIKHNGKETVMVVIGTKVAIK